MFGPFFHNYRYYSVITKCEKHAILQNERCGITLKVIIKVRKDQFGPL